MANTPIYDSTVDDENDERDEGRHEDKPAQVKPKGPQVKESFRLYHAYGGTFTDFENEDDLLDFVKEATTVKQRRNPDGSTENVYSPNAHLVHGAAHADYPNLRVEKHHEIVFPEDDE